ncbi:MAG TPA: PorV/PorQ family protein [Parafilimonas sp.]|nr:PorV/PorQ family protein [Parafilimonas sp.]
MKTCGRLFVLMILACSSLCGFTQFRKYSNEFLNIGAGARGLAMGGAQVASAEDGNAGYWNPAGLVNVIDNPSVSLMHAEYFAGIGKYDYLSTAIPMSGGYKTLGFSLLRFGVDDIPNTLFLVQPDGSLDYNNIQSFSSADYAFLMSYAQVINDNDTRAISWGANTKIIYRNVGSFAKAWGFGFDAGFLYRSAGLRFGVSARDVTTTFNAWSFSFTDAEKQVLYLTNNDIPVKSTELTAPTLVPAIGYNFRFTDKLHLLAEADFDVTFDGQRNTLISSDPISIDPKFGMEVNIANTVFIRAGVSNFQRALADGDTLNQKRVWIYQPSLGAGFKVGNVAIDYAFTNLANQSNPLYTNVFSLYIDLVPKGKEKTHKGSFPELQRPEKPKKVKGNYPVP